MVQEIVIFFQDAGMITLVEWWRESQQFPNLGSRLCYYDTRIRKEALDLQFMMASLDRPAAAGTVPSA